MNKNICLIISTIITAVLMTGCENLYYDAYDSANPNVYVGGLARPGGYASVYGLYWKNGAMTYLTPYAQYNTANSVFAYKGKTYIVGVIDNKAFYSIDGGAPVEISGCIQANSIFVYDNDVYIAGMNTSSYPDIWKNGISQSLPTAQLTVVNSIFVYNGVVYAAGTDKSSVHYGVYWDNTDNTVNMTEATKTSLAGYTPTTANSIFIYKGRIYIAGSTQAGSDNVACYWDLSTGNNPVILSTVNYSSASSIFVSEGDVYVSGCVSSKAVYWENGQINYLSDNESYTESIFVYNDDVYIAGRVEPDGDHEVATYWKNGEAVSLYNGTYNTQALSIFVSGE